MTFYCISVIDMVDSTNTIASIAPERVTTYYGIYLNALAGIAEHFGAKIIKNAGDALIIYFPKTIDSSNQNAFREVVKCCFSMKEARSHINSIMELQQLPPVSYRISSDYGPVDATRSKTSFNEDLFGSTMNLCAKMNARAPVNGIIIGSDLYQIFKSHSLEKRYIFKKSGEFSIGMKSAYPLYSIEQHRKDAGLDGVDVIINDAVSNETALAFSLKQDAHSNHSISRFKHPAAANFTLGETPRQARILLIDDDNDILFVYDNILKKAGYEVETFNDSQNALNSFAIKSTAAHNNAPCCYDLVITDIRMPGVNGLELYRIFKLLDGRIKIALVTALDISDELRVMIPEIRKEHVISKPVENEQLLRRVRAILAE